MKENFEVIDYDPFTATVDRREWYRSIHQHGTVPALVTPEGILVEGGGIVLYLADRYQQLLPPYSERANYYK